MQIKKNRLSDLHNNEVEFPREKLHLSYVKSPGFYYGYKTLGEKFDNTVALHGERPAMISRFFDKIYPREMVWTWNQMNEMVTNLALGLLNLGLKKGDKMGICADSTPNFWIPQLACAKIGVIFFPIPPRHRHTEFHHVLSHSKAKGLFFTEKDWATGFSFIDMLNQFKADLPDLEHLIISRGELKKGTISMYELMGKDQQTKYPKDYINKTYLKENPVLPEDLRDLQYTSGTTGNPKGVVCTYNARNYQTWGGNIRINLTKDDVYLCMAPATHATATSHIMDSAVLSGGALVMPGAFDPKYTLELIDKYKVSFTAGVPAFFIMMMNHPDFSKYDLSSLKKMWIGGAACPEATSLEIKEKIGGGEAQLFAAYGMTETGGDIMTSSEDPVEVFSTTVGKPCAGVEMSIQDGVENVVSVGTPGEVCHRGGVLMVEYYKNPEATQKTIDKKGWLHSGDVGLINKDGNLKIIGRSGDKINRGGEIIYVREVEEILFKHPKIMEINIVGYPDKAMDERSCAFVILKKKDETLTREEIVGFLAGKIAKYKIPDRIEFVDSFPLSAGGKVQKFKLKKIIAEKVKNKISD